jgi:hypothetical protein
MLKRLTNEHLLYALALSLALGIRLFELGAAPLSDFEAGWALQAWQAARGGELIPGAQPGYIFPTAGLFFIFGSSNFLARFWPALAGGLLALAPWGLRRQLGRKAALIAAFGLALDPGLAALARLAGGPIPAVAFAALAVALWLSGRAVLAGICAGLASLSGPALIPGLIGLAVVLGVGRWLGFFRAGNPVENAEPAQAPALEWRRALFAGLATLALVGAGLFLYPKGMGGWAQTLPEYLAGWGAAATIPSGRLLAALIVYQPLALVFGLAAALRGWFQTQPLARALSLWLAVALGLALLYPARQVGDAAWALLPLWLLAGLELARFARRSLVGPASLGQAMVVLVLGSLVWLNFQGLGVALAEAVRFHWVVIFGAVILGFLTVVLVAFGWSWEAARAGMVLGTVSVLGVYLLAALAGVTLARPGSVQELWTPAPAAGQVDWMQDTLADLARWQTGRSDTLEVVSLVDSPALHWLLRDFSGVRFAEKLAADEIPAVFIAAADQSEPAQAAGYRGQDFWWALSPAWDSALPENALLWLTRRQSSVAVKTLVLWARGDLFPDQSVLDPASPGGE